MAYFSDSESSSGNTVQAGTLDLKLNGGDQTVTFFDETGVVPGDSGSGSVTLGNAGSTPGIPEIEVAAVRSTENGRSGSQTDGDLDDYLEIAVSIDGQTVVQWDPASQMTVGEVHASASTVSGGGSVPCTVSWALPSDTGNEAQGDGFGFDLTFRLTQESGA